MYQPLGLINFSILFNKFPDCQVLSRQRPEGCNFIKKEALAQVFFCEFCETSKENFFLLSSSSGALGLADLKSCRTLTLYQHKP